MSRLKKNRRDYTCRILLSHFKSRQNWGIKESINKNLEEKMEVEKSAETLEALATARQSPIQVISPWDKSRGLIHCHQVDAGGTKKRWDITRFKLDVKIDRIKKDWFSHGWGYNKNSPFTQKDDDFYWIDLRYAYVQRVLSLKIQGYIFTASSREMQANNYTNTNVLNISFLRDVVGTNPSTGDSYTIEGRSKLDIVI